MQRDTRQDKALGSGTAESASIDIKGRLRRPAARLPAALRAALPRRASGSKRSLQVGCTPEHHASRDQQNAADPRHDFED
jgi:hypothetical protein